MKSTSKFHEVLNFRFNVVIFLYFEVDSSTFEVENIEIRELRDVRSLLK
jgi:hypothetical protein